jgi:hypothetical protein
MPALRGEAATEYLKKQGLYGSLGEAMEAARYGVYPSSPREGKKLEEAFYADNPEQSWRAGFTPEGLTLHGSPACGASWEFRMRLRSAGYGERQMAVSAGRLSAKGARIEYERAVRIEDRGSEINPQSAIIEWYVNKDKGLEQGFTLAAPLAERVGEEPLVLRLELTGDLRARADADGLSVTLSRKSGARALSYDHLAVVDAEGRKLAARLEAAGNEMRIVVDDRGASYPVTIDPTFREIRKLTASDGAAGDAFGQSVAIYGDTVIVGAFQDTIGNLGQGSAYIFERNQGGTNNWGEVKKLTASDGAANHTFGRSVAIYEDKAIITASRSLFNEVTPGAAYIFERNQGGANNWGEVDKLTASDGVGFDQFGVSVAIYEDTAIVGASTDDIGSNVNQGSAYVFFAGNLPPTISAAPVTRVEGTPAINSIIATVSDPNQAASTLAVTVNGSTSATVNGVTVSNITVEASGEVKADVAQACGASNAAFSLLVTDSEGLSSDVTLDVTVTPEAVAPTITLQPSIQLWPPNHEYHTVTIVQMVESVSDNCSSLGLGDVVIEKVTSDEPDNGLDDGNTTNDIVIGPDCRSVELRAERAETSDGRVYTITLRLSDSRGNVTRRDFEVSMPISEIVVPAVKGASEHTVTGGCQ